VKPILVLASSPNSGFAWIASHGDSHRDKHHHSWFTASNTAELEHVLTTQFVDKQMDDIDVEGYILPDFQHNPQKALMIELIINHKRRISNASAEKFVKNVLVPNKESLLQP
jgi:hypothetical protein